jgi:hypothetical protein
MALLQTLYDNFNDNSLNAQWSEFEGGSATVNETNRRLEINYPASSTSSTDGDIASNSSFDLTGSYGFVQVSEVPSSATSANAELRIYTDSSNWFRWIYEGGTLFAQRRKAGASATITSFTYSATTHKFWRIRESAGVIYYDTSADGLTWTNQGTYTHGMTITAMHVLIAGTCFQNETNPGRFIVDNFNVIPMQLFNDNFDDNSVDTAKWTKFEAGGAYVSEINGRLEVHFPVDTIDTTDGDISSVNTFDLSESYAYMQVIKAPSNQTNANGEIRLYADGDNWFRWVKEAGSLFVQRKNAGDVDSLKIFSYNPTIHRWWRIRESGGVVYWETSKDSQLWTIHGSYTHGMDIHAMRVLIAAIGYQDELNPGLFIVDNFNVAEDIPDPDAATSQPVTKQYYYKVFDGATIKGVWTDDVISEPRFKVNINSGYSDMNIVLARQFDNFGEDVDVKLNNRVECWVIDKESPNGKLLYTGYIAGYAPELDEEEEKVQVTLFPFEAELNRMVLRDSSGNTTLAYNSYDPGNILKDAIDKYKGILGGHLRYTSTSIALTNTVVSYTFNTNTLKEVLDKVVELCPVGWYYRIDPDGVIYLQPRNLLADYTFTLGLEVTGLRTYRRIEDLVNRVLFVGGGDPPLFRKYENTGSQQQYGLYEKKIVDQRVTVVATAQTMSEREIEQKKDPEIRSTFTIMDSNGRRSKGFDIESLQVGKTLKIKNLNTGRKAQSLWDTAVWDVDVWDQTLSTSAADIIQILSLSYEPDSIVIEASSRLPQIAKRIEDIDRNLQASQTVNNPAAPS